MPTRLSLLILVHGWTVYCWNESSVIVEKDSLSTGPPEVLPYSIPNGGIRTPPDLCWGQQVSRSIADGVDLRKMMGRWFVGFADQRYQHHVQHNTRYKSISIKCITYEFDRLIIAHHTTSFGVKITYQGGREFNEFGIMRSSEPRSAMLNLFVYDRQNGEKFWIYKYGPESQDSSGKSQYEYAMVGGCLGIDMVLVRNPESFEEKHEKEILAWMGANGHRIQPDHPFAQQAYSDCDFDVGARFQHLPVDVCNEGARENHTVAGEVDMRKMIGRWFVGLAKSGRVAPWRIWSPGPLFHHRVDRDHHKCMVYEFDRLIFGHNTTAFDATITYPTRDNEVMREFTYMRSSEPRRAMLAHFASTFQHQYGRKFWIYKVGPEGKDSFGRSQYEYAIIGSCRIIRLVLVRNPHVFSEIYKNEIVDWMEANGFRDPGFPFIQPAYSECYFDSVTETFGASDEGNHDASTNIPPSILLKTENNNSCDASNATLAKELDTRKMMGRWFEGLSSLPTENQSCVVLEYRRLEFVGENFTLDGHYSISFEVQKTYREEGFPLRKDGPTTVWSNDEEVPKFGSQFWVYKVGPEGKNFSGRIQYEYIIVSNCEKSFVRVLIRNPAMFEEKYNKRVLKWLKENNFNVGEDSGFFQPDYTFCHYADSITMKVGQ